MSPVIAIMMALSAGILVGMSRAINGRLSLSTGALRASMWNHVVGFGILILLALILRPEGFSGMKDAPLLAWLGGPVGVIFVASGSFLVARIGAARTAILVIAGQMIFGIALDAALFGVTGILLKSLGAVAIVAGVYLIQSRPAEKA